MHRSLVAAAAAATAASTLVLGLCSSAWLSSSQRLPAILIRGLMRLRKPRRMDEANRRSTVDAPPLLMLWLFTMYA